MHSGTEGKDRSSLSYTTHESLNGQKDTRSWLSERFYYFHLHDVISLWLHHSGGVSSETVLHANTELPIQAQDLPERFKGFVLFTVSHSFSQYICVDCATWIYSTTL